MNLAKSALIASVCSVLVGLTIAVLAILLANLIEQIEVQEIESKRQIISQLIKETIDLNARNFDTVTNSVMGLYVASEHVTADEFATFAGYMVASSSSISNILVFQDGVVVRSYPMDKFIGWQKHMFESTITHENIRYIIFNSQEISGTTVSLFIDPVKIVPVHSVLEEPFKVVLYIDGNRFFGITDSKHGYGFDMVMTSEEMEKSLEVNTSMTLTKQGTTKNLSFDYLIYQAGFERHSHWIWTLTVLGGLSASAIISSLLFLEIRARYEIRAKNKQLKLNSKILKKTESLLLESEEKFRNLFELSPVPVAMLDLDGNLVSYNSMAAEVFGYDREEGVGRHFLEFVSKSDSKLSLDLFRTVIATGKITNAQIQCRKKNGQTFDAKISANTMINKDAQISGVIVVLIPLG